MPRSRFSAVLLLAAAAAVVAQLSTPAAASAAATAAAAPPATCDTALASRQRSFYGHCPCDCQLQSVRNFNCKHCPVTCRRYAALCRPKAVCQQQPAGIMQALWPSDCIKVAAGAKCYAKCKPGFTGAGVTAQCTPQGWSKPSVQCVAAARKSRTATPKTAGVAAGLAAAAAGPGRQQVLQQSAGSSHSAMRMQASQQIYLCPALPPAVTGADWAADCAGIAAGKVCRAACRGSDTVGFKTVCKANGAWTNPRGAGCGPARSNGLQEKAVGSQQAFLQPLAAGKCQGTPPAVPGAVWATCNGLEAGQSCTAACNEAGTVGEWASACSTDGTWGPASGSCSKYAPDITCSGSPKPVEGATWPDCTGFRPGDQCVASGCSPGYIGQGYVSNCMLDGTWNDIWGDCRKPGTVITTESGGNHV